MLKQNGGGICDHEVGTGKTLIMCIAAHEMKRLNLAHKPMIIGLKANVAERLQPPIRRHIPTHVFCTLRRRTFRPPTVCASSII